MLILVLLAIITIIKAIIISIININNQDHQPNYSVLTKPEDSNVNPCVASQQLFFQCLCLQHLQVRCTMKQQKTTRYVFHNNWTLETLEKVKIDPTYKTFC